jgi:hypothetical protein
MTRILALQAMQGEGFEQVGMDQMDMNSSCSYAGCADCSTCSGQNCSNTTAFLVGA